MIDGMTVSSLRAISRALEMPSLVSMGWRAPEIDRLRDRRHAAMVEQMVGALGASGWETRPEHSFSHYGERGAIDILAWHAPTGTLLVVEVKTRLWDIQDLLSVLDRKRRLLPGLVRREIGWQARAIGVLLVLPEMSTHRHVVDRHSSTFGAALPHRQREVRSWLANPVGDLRGILFFPNSHHDYIGQRARARRARARRKSGDRASNPTPKRPNRTSDGR